jgi:D-alanine--D-alanine ligase
MKKILVVAGSYTNENRYGVISADRVVAALEEYGATVSSIHATNAQGIFHAIMTDRPDLIVPVGFGPPCEDGHIYALARMASIPCAGPTPAAGSVMLDKSLLSTVVDSIFKETIDVRSPKGITITKNTSPEEALTFISHLQLPLVVKPNYSGSSEGLSVATEYNVAITEALKLVANEGKVLIQELETDIAHEISCTVLDDQDGTHFLPIVKLQREDVLVLGAEEKFGESGLDRHVVPAPFDDDLVDRIKNVVLTLHVAVGACGLTRTDILVKKNGELVILELNGIPGLLTSSIACDSARAAGIEFNQLAVKYAKSAFLDRVDSAIWG